MVIFDSVTKKKNENMYAGVDIFIQGYKKVSSACKLMILNIYKTVFICHVRFMFPLAFLFRG